LNSNSREISIEINIPSCTGCRACELACSFYLTETCNPAMSKIKISRDNETGDIFCDLPASCSECSSEDEPPCVSACGSGALKVKEMAWGQ
jgi:anaerobic carbon-monoxide dehydrogenase iron sulfur subunit